MKKTILIIITTIILLGAIILFYNISTKEEKKTKENNQEQIISDKKKDKYTKEENEKLEKLDYINEKISYFKFENIDRYLAYKDKNKNLDNEKVVLLVNIGIDKDFYTNTVKAPNENENTILVNKYYYLEESHVPTTLELIDSAYQIGGKKLKKDAAIAFNKLAKNAKDEGFTIRAISTYRSFNYQKNLYTNYSKKDGKEKADTYSARPGFSEHQTGLSLDIDNGKTSYTSFGLTKEFNWMQDNAYKYGFILRYTKENEYITGYKNEPWHYRYVGIDIAKKMKDENISSYEEYYFKYLDNKKN